MKLNNKGLTAVEILVCFVLMVILTVSMYSSVISYKNKQNIESDRDKIVAYKNLLTKEIQDDLIKKGLVDAKLVENISSDGNNTDKYYKVEFTFKDGTKKILEVTAQYARDFDVCTGSLSAAEEAACKYDKDDVLKIGYGSAPGADDYVSYDLPDLGYGYNGNVYASEYGRQCSGNYDKNGVELDDADKKGCKVYDFRLSNVVVETEEIFNFYVGFYHPDFETRYGIDIIYPISLSIEQSALDLGPICGAQTPERVDWDNTGEVTISVECVAREGGSPCTQSHFSETFTDDSKVNYIIISSDDGNETRCPVMAYIDKTKPNTPTVVATELFPSGTWRNAPFTLTVTSLDRHSGIAYYQYCYPGADNNCGYGEWTTYENSMRAELMPGEFTYETTPFSAERSENVWIRAVDRAGNASEPGSFRINLDKNAPIISNVNFDRATRLLTATIVDNASKVAGYALTTSTSEPTTYTNVTNTTTYNLSFTVPNGYRGMYYIWAKDGLGNVGARASVEVGPNVPNVVVSHMCANTRAGSEPYEFTYTGNCQVINDGSNNWRVKFLTNGTLTFKSDVELDVFLVGGGGGGGGYYDYGGGGGGYTKTEKNIFLLANNGYSIKIGAGGSPGAKNVVATAGEASSAFGYSADGGGGARYGADYGGHGGSGGSWTSNVGGSDGSSGYAFDETGRSYPGREGTGQGSTTREFGESTGQLYAGGGGGGGYDDSDNRPGAGGAGGGGSGGSHSNGHAGGTNTGGGGGGSWKGNSGGAGGSGIVVIRNRR